MSIFGEDTLHLQKLDLQEFATLFSHSMLDKTELWGHTELWGLSSVALYGRQIDINFAQSSPTQSMKACDLCLPICGKSWKINILKPKHLEVWLEDDVPFHLDYFLGSSRILQGCMPSLDMLQLGYHQ